MNMHGGHDLSLQVAHPDDGDLLRLALAKIQELQGQVMQLQGSETTTGTPATTPRGSPNESTPGAPTKKNSSAAKAPQNPDASDDDDKPGEEEPIRTPDGVAVPWLPTRDFFFTLFDTIYPEINGTKRNISCHAAPSSLKPKRSLGSA